MAKCQGTQTMIVLQITDLHIPVEGNEHIRDNFLKIMAYVHDNPPDLLVVSGDLAYDEGNAYKWTLAQIPDGVLTAVIPGNHDDCDSLYRVFGNELIESDDFFYIIAEDQLDLVFANTATNHFPRDQLHRLQSNDIRPGSVLFVHHPPRKLANGFMDINYPLQNIEETGQALANSNIGHVFCGHYHTDHHSSEGYNLHVTPSPAFELDLYEPEFTFGQTRVPLRHIDIQGTTVSTRLIEL